MLRVGLSMDSRIFREWLQGSKLVALKSSLYHWKAIETYMSKMGSYDPFGHLEHKLWSKERSKVKNRPNCDMPLKSSWWGLQLHFRPHPNQRSTQEVISSQVCKSSNFDDFKTPILESRDKKPFGWGHCGEVQSILYGGRWWLPLSPSCGESCEYKVARGSS
jgi:hypothetical protein